MEGSQRVEDFCGSSLLEQFFLCLRRAFLDVNERNAAHLSRW